MNKSPLYSELKQLLDYSPLRFDMPGHHGKPLPYFIPADWTGLDCTEHDSTGDLFSGGDSIESAELLWAQKWDADGCLFLTGGSTEGVHVALHLACKPGDTILVDRGSHRSLWNGMALLDIHPLFVTRPWDSEQQITCPLEPEQVDQLWTDHPEAKALFLTSPTYYGICSDITALADIAHKHHGLLVVDGAHGAHFPWIGLPSPCQQGADILILSAHKELPVPGQSSLLLYNGFSPEQVRNVASIYGSSSPNYIMMAAMDRSRVWLDESDAYLHLISQTLPAFRKKLEKETPFRLLENDDPARLVIQTSPGGYSGYQLLSLLEKQHILIEMADLTHLVLIASCLDNEQDYTRLIQALRDLSLNNPLVTITLPSPPPLPQQVFSLRQAMFASKASYPLSECEGMIAGEQIAPYPPGIPVIVPGERIEKKHLVYLRKIGYNIDQNGVVCTRDGA